MTESFLVFDLGNTNLTIGLYRNGERETTWRLSTDQRRTADEWAVYLGGLLGSRGPIDRVALASVVPAATEALTQAVKRSLGQDALIVSHLTPGALVDVQVPSSVGADRLANAVGARVKYPLPAIVVDFGTATNFDVVSEEGKYIGGAIAPGVGVSMEALLHKASQLPGFALEAPPTAIGKTTIACLQSGLVFGFAGQVDAIVDRIQAELPKKAVVVATGGYSHLIAGESRTIETVDPDLTVDGLFHLLKGGA